MFQNSVLRNMFLIKFYLSVFIIYCSINSRFAKLLID